MLTVSFLSLLLFSAVVPSMAQEAILTFVPPSEAVVLTPGATISVQWIVSNRSVYEAEELEFDLIAKVEGLTVAWPPLLEALDPYSEQAIQLSISAAADLAPGSYPLTLEAIYSYCVDVSCFQITEVLEFEVDVVEHRVVVTVDGEGSSGESWTWLILTLFALAIVGSVLLIRFFNTILPVYFVLSLVVFGGLVYGVLQGRHEQARAIGSVLCTSCVGIEETRRATPTLTLSARTALDTLSHDVALLVFHAPWCRSCPYAEAMVEAMGAATEHLTYRLIDVERQPSLAVRYGVVRLGRTVVPAVVRQDTGEVIFGIEDLEARMLSLLGVGS